jgi:NTE family protein
MELFESVDYQLIEEDGLTGIVVDARARSWGPDYLQFAFSLSGDTGGESTFNLGLAYLKTEINDLGGEIRFSGQVGADPLIAVDWYQPLDYDTRYFFEPILMIGEERLNVYTADGDRKLAQYDIDRVLLEVSGGRELGDFGEVRIGYRVGTGDVELKIGSPALPEGGFDTGSVFGRFGVDRLDNPYFPSEGYSGNIEYEMFREDLGNDTNLDQLRTDGAYFVTFDKNTFGIGGTFNATLDGSAQVQNRFRLGGFLRLSGYDVNSLSGQYSGVVSGVYYRRFAEFRLLPWYVGGSLEAGNVWEDSDDISLDSLIASGSVFVGAETPVGPFHAGYGFAENGHSAWFFLFGRHF